MPLDAQHGWDRAEMVTAEEILAALGREFSLTARRSGQRGSAPAETYLVDGGPARVGVIASVTRPFCGTCDRVRLTADGQVRNCLFARDRDRPAGPAAGRGERRGAGRARGGAPSRRSCPGTASTTRRSCSPTAPMSAIGG